MTEPLDVAQKYLAELRIKILQELVYFPPNAVEDGTAYRIAEARKIEAYLLEAGK